MIFICLSSKDRNLVESIVYHLKNLALPVWYDRHEILMSEDRDYKNFIEGISNKKYSIVIFSKNAMESQYVNEELKLIKKMHTNKKMNIFVLFYDINPNELPEKYKWMTTLVYKEITNETGTLSACNHIICKISKNEILEKKMRNFNDIIKMSNNKYIVKMLNTYFEVDGNNFNARITLIYSIYQYILCNNDFSNVPHYYYYGIERLFMETKLDLISDLRDIQIIENLLILLINYFY